MSNWTIEPYDMDTDDAPGGDCGEDHADGDDNEDGDEDG